jgi:hypothetical protein
MLDVPFHLPNVGCVSIDAFADPSPVALNPQSARRAATAEILRGMPAFGLIIPTEYLAITLGMRPSDTCIVLAVPD